MQIKLYPHQAQFLDENPNKQLLNWEVGTGKSLATFEWIKLRPTLSHLIIVPKNIKKRWIADISTSCPQISTLILTKEEFKKYPISAFAHIQSVVVDEADFFASPLFTKGRSQLSEHLYDLLDKNNIQHILLLTATPYRNAPHNIHTLLAYIDRAPEWKEWREDMYSLVTRPYNPRPFYEPKKDWRTRAVEYATPRMSVVRMSDIVTIPTQHETSHPIKTPILLQPKADTQVGAWHEKARRESGPEKLKWVEQYVQDKSKVVIVSRYKEVIATYAKALAKKYQVYTLTGETKDQEKVIHLAEKDPECILLIQADIGAGFEIPSFSYMVFVNLPFSHRSYVQMKGRINRINRLKENFYVHLIGGPKDKSVYNAIIEMNQDFRIE